MATEPSSSRLALRATPSRLLADGAWWPRSRTLGDELAGLVEAWPTDSGRIVRVLYSPPDWDDRPRSAAVSGRRIKTGSFPKDDTHRLVLTVLGGQRFTLDVIPAETASEDAVNRLETAAGVDEAARP